jgi:D-alanyl-D-alanine carboxypeptidase (penicillin-binding protein 5/6)
MTIYLTFELLAEERLAPDDTFPVSEKAWRMGGSKMFVEVGSRVAIEDLLRGVIIQSGNDACIVLAEGIAGSEEAFAEQMNRKAAELGLMDSYFVNATGWPDESHVMSVRDIAQISYRLIHDFPDYYPLFAELEFTYSGIRQGNRNPLLYKGLGADGLKTGHTEASGYGLAASAVQNDRRVIFVLHGLESVNERSREAERLLSYGTREFDNYPLFKKDEVVLDAEVWLGQEALVPLILDEALTVTLKRRSRSDLKVAVVYDGPIPAPIEAGEEVAQLVISAPDLPTLEFPLRAQRSIERLSGFGRIGAAISYLLWGPGG